MKHDYIVNNIEIPSVTKVLKIIKDPDPLMYWAVKMAIQYLKNHPNKYEEAQNAYKQYRDDKKDIGSDLHNILSGYISSKLFNKSYSLNIDHPVIQKGFNLFKQWENEYIHEWLESEQPVCSLRYLFGGTLDFIAKNKNNETVLGDFKFTGNIYPENIKQVSSYKLAREEIKPDNKFNIKFIGDDYNYDKTIIQQPIKIDRLGILQIDIPNNKYTWLDCTDKYRIAVKSFLRLLDFYYADAKRRLKNNKRAALME